MAGAKNLRKTKALTAVYCTMLCCSEREREREREREGGFTSGGPRERGTLTREFPDSSLREEREDTTHDPRTRP